MPDQKTLKGTLRISRFEGPDGPGVGIELKDTMSGTVVARAQMSFEDYAIAATSGQGLCTFTPPSKVVGKVRETKQEWVPAPEGKTDPAKLAKFEVDGWKARTGDYGNHHRWGQRHNTQGFNVTFTRYVDPTDPQ
jgi:hypothetical protein